MKIQTPLPKIKSLINGYYGAWKEYRQRHLKTANDWLMLLFIVFMFLVLFISMYQMFCDYWTYNEDLKKHAV